MTQADRDALVAAAQVLLREGIGATFWDTGEDTLSNGDAAEMLFELAGWGMGNYNSFPEQRGAAFRPALVAAAPATTTSRRDVNLVLCCGPKCFRIALLAARFRGLRFRCSIPKRSRS
jgi:hypothetical protein